MPRVLDFKRAYGGSSRLSALYLGSNRLARLRRNLCQYPNAENGTAVTGWSITGTGVTIATSNAQAHSGTQSFRCITPGSATNEGISQDPRQLIPSGTAGPETVSLWVFAPAGATFLFALEEYTTAAGFVSSRAAMTFTATGAWQRVTLTGTKATATNVLRCYVRTNTAVAPQAVTFYVDDALNEAVASALPYFDGSTSRAEWVGAVNASASTLWDA